MDAQVSDGRFRQPLRKQGPCPVSLAEFGSSPAAHVDSYIDILWAGGINCYGMSRGIHDADTQASTLPTFPIVVPHVVDSPTTHRHIEAAGTGVLHRQRGNDERGREIGSRNGRTRPGRSHLVKTPDLVLSGGKDKPCRREGDRPAHLRQEQCAQSWCCWEARGASSLPHRDCCRPDGIDLDVYAH